MIRAGGRPRAALRVAITDSQGRVLGRGAAAGLGRWLARAAPARAHGALAIAIIPDDVMRRLNREYRGKDRVTDVLSFPASQTPALKGRPTSDSAGRQDADFLGDLAIARGVAARQARELGHPLRVELRILALHGLLHLLGYDHVTDRGQMARLENRLRRRAGLPSGLIGRQ